MPFETQWHPEPLIHLTRFSGDISEADLNGWAAELQALMDVRTEPLFLIIDMSAHDRFMANAMTMPDLAQMFSHPLLGWSGIIGITPLVSMWLELLGRTTRVRFKLFPSVDDATDFLLQYIAIEKDRGNAAQNPQP